MSQLKILTMKYDQSFTAEKGVLYQFPDFKIQYLGITPMSVEAKREKEAANAEGLDGGASMNTDSQDFEVIGNDGKPLYKISMQMVPYAWDRFEYNKKKFNFEYDDNNSDQFVIRDGPLMRDRPKTAEYARAFYPYEEKGVHFPDFDLRYVDSERKGGEQIKQYFNIFREKDSLTIEYPLKEGKWTQHQFTFRRKSYVLSTLKPDFIKTEGGGYIDWYIYPTTFIKP